MFFEGVYKFKSNRNSRNKFIYSRLFGTLIKFCIIIMTRGKKSEESESVEDVVKRVVKATWAEEAMAQGIANLIRESICEELKKTIEMNTSVIQDLKNALAERDIKIKSLEEKLVRKTDDLEQYQRRQSLRIFGVEETEGENTDCIARDIAVKIGVELSDTDIDRSHRVGRKSENKHRPIIVKFVSYRKRSEMYRNKKKLKNSGIVLREDLTQLRYKLLQDCITRFGLRNVWTVDGAIMVSTENGKRRITSAADIEC